MSVTTLVDNFEGKKLNAPNDLVYRSDGTLYFTDPPYGLPLGDDDPSKELPFNGVFKLERRKAEADHQRSDPAERDCVFARREDAVRVQFGREAPNLDALRRCGGRNGEQRPRVRSTQRLTRKAAFPMA